MFIIVSISIIIVLIIFAIGILVYARKKATPFFTVLSNINNFIGPYIYLILLPMPLAYLFYYYISLYSGNQSGLGDVGEYLKTLSLTFFSAGIFSATFKLLNSLVFFKDNFKNIIISDDFDELLTKKFDSITLSSHYLLGRTDLEEIWKRVTLCKYEQKFPLLKTDINLIIENDFFNEASLAYYYKNFKTLIKFYLKEDDILEIVEISNFILIPSKQDEIEMNFSFSYNEELGETFSLEYFKVNNEDKVKDNEKGISTNRNDEKSIMHYKFNSSRTINIDCKTQDKFYIERKTIIRQYLSKDPVFSFSSLRLIDNLDIKLEMDEGLRYFFSPIGKNIFKEDNTDISKNTYISTEILMPGELFKLFISKTESKKEEIINL